MHRGLTNFTWYIRRAILPLKRLARLIVVILTILALGLSLVALGIAEQANVLAIRGFQLATSTIFISEWNLSLSWFLGNTLIITGILFCFFGLVRIFVKYNMNTTIPIQGKVKVTLGLSLPKRILLLNIPPNWEEVKFQISYRNTNDSFPIDCYWGDGKGLWLFINEPIREEIQLYYLDKDSNPLRLNNRERLPDNLEYEIRLVNRDKRIKKRHLIR